MQQPLITALALGAFLTGFAPAANPTTDIIGPWKVAAAGVPNAKQQLLDRAKRTSPALFEQLEANPGVVDQLVGAIYNYKADGTLEITTPQSTQTSKWRLSADKHFVLRTRADGTETKDSIVSVSAKQLVLAALPLRLPVVYERPK